MPADQNKTFFPNLNGLRFLLAFSIIILHIEDIKILNNRESIMTFHIAALSNWAAIVVTAFFVLSGFLITYLIIKEKQDTKTVHIKQFYKRRILRIWPLYYFILLLGFFILPHLHISDLSDLTTHPLHKYFWLKFGFALLFIPPSLAGGKAKLNETLGQVWSVRVEETFYLCWPLILRKTHDYIKLFLWIITFFIAIRIGFEIIEIILKPTLSEHRQKIITAVAKFFDAYRIDCMVIGGIGAYLVAFDKRKILSIIYRKDFQIVLYAITATVFGFNIYPPIIAFEFYSVLFCLIIINLGTNPKSILNLNYKWLDYLGKTAYGLYMYNSITRIFSLKLIEHIYGKQISGWQMETALYLFSITSTIIIAILSYEILEKPFLKMKTKNTL